MTLRATRPVSLLALGSAVIGLALATAVPADGATPPTAGQLLGFGANDNAQLAMTPSNAPDPTPAVVTIPGTGSVVSTAVSQLTSFVLKGTDIYGFGDNSDGQLAQTVSTGTNKYIKAPTKVVLPSGAGNPLQVAAAESFTLALTVGNKIYGWGLDGDGVLGRTPTNSSQTTPIPLSFPTGNGVPVKLAVGDNHVLVLTSTGRVLSFGDDYYGELGYADPSGDNINPTPAPVTLPGNATVTAISAGVDHSLVLTSDGKVYGFGDNREGELGTSGAQPTNSTPVLYPLPAGVTAMQISAGSGFSLVLGSDGKVYASGGDTYGETGTAPATATVTTPTAVVMPAGAAPVLRITAAGIAGYALTNTGQVVSWGNNASGELGTTATADANPPTIVTSLAGTVDQLPVGSSGRTVLALVSDLMVTTASLPAGQADSAYATTASSTGGYAGGTITWTASGLPAGLTISSAGAISGTPTAASSSTVTLTASDVEGVLASASLPLTIAADPNPPVTTPPTTTPPATTPPTTTPPTTTPPVVTPPAPGVPVTVKAPSNSAIISALVANLVPKGKSAAFAVLAKKGYSQTVSVLETGKLTVTWTYQPRHGKKITVATGTTTFTRTGLSHLTVKLTKAGAALLKAGHTVGLTFQAAFVHSSQKLAATKTGSLK